MKGSMERVDSEQHEQEGQRGSPCWFSFPQKVLVLRIIVGRLGAA